MSAPELHTTRAADVTPQSLRALDAHTRTRGPEPLRDTLESVESILRADHDITVVSTYGEAFVLAANLNGAAFDDPAELPRILRQVADHLEYGVHGGGVARDTNGNTAASWRYIREGL